MKNISTHITYKEATRTDTRLPNIPNDEQLRNMKIIAEAVFEPIREYFNKPIIITSFFRSKEVNKKIGGSKNSQHCLGQAMDIDAQMLGGLHNYDIFDYIYKYLEYDQLIWEAGDDFEPGWVHVSYKEKGNRFQVLKMKKGKYENFVR